MDSNSISDTFLNLDYKSKYVIYDKHSMIDNYEKMDNKFYC